MAKISVGMFTYNRPNTLKRAATSILNQTFKDLELVLVNNGSTIPKVTDICKDIAESDCRVKYLEVYPNNITEAYKTILQNSTGEFYTQMDDDDYCESDILEFLYELASEYNADISMCGSYRVINGKAIERFAFDEIIVMDKVQALDEFLKRQICSTAVWSKLFKREKVIANTGWAAHAKQGDADTVYKWFSNADKVVAHGIPKYYQVRTESDDLYGYVGKHNLTPELLDNYLEIFRDRTNYLSQKVPKIKERVRYSEWSFMISMYDKIYSYGLSNFDKQIKFIKNELKFHFEEFCNGPFIQEFEKEFMVRYINK